MATDPSASELAARPLSSLVHIDAATVTQLIPIVDAVEALRRGFAMKAFVPARQQIVAPGGKELLIMPAFNGDGASAVKLTTIDGDNRVAGLPSIQAVIVLFSSQGVPVALIDGTYVTKLRTSAASALASTYLSRPDAAHLTLFGTGALAPFMAAAHAAVRPIRSISIIGRSSAHAEATTKAIAALAGGEIEILCSESVEDAVRRADIICCATASARPLFSGAFVRPGTFVDLVGSYSPGRRESDDDLIRRARLFVDTRTGCLEEAGDLLDPISRGIITPEAILGELADLVSGRVTGRNSNGEITVFKSVGTALEDLIIAELVFARHSASVLARPDRLLGRAS